MAIYTVRTTSGREDIVIDILASKIKAEGLDIKTLFHPAEIKGYIFIEGSLGAIQKAVYGVMHVRSIIEKPLNLEEIRHFLEYKKDRIKVDVDDIVYLVDYIFTGGPAPDPLVSGDVNRTDCPLVVVDIDDVTHLVAYIFSGGDPPNCECP